MPRAGGRVVIAGTPRSKFTRLGLNGTGVGVEDGKVVRGKKCPEGPLCEVAKRTAGADRNFVIQGMFPSCS